MAERFGTMFGLKEALHRTSAVWRIFSLGATFSAVLPFIALQSSDSFARDQSKAGAYQETVVYDSDKCSPPVTDGKVRIAFGKRVLAWPQHRIGPIRGMSPEEYAKLAVPPDPNAPEGCPEHPMTGGGFPLGFDYQASVDGSGSGQTKPARGSARLIFVPPDFRGTQPGNARGFAGRCRAEGIIEIVADSFIACRVRPNDRKRAPGEWGVSFLALPSVYEAPDGRPFIISCLGGPEARGSTCHVGYRLLSTANVAYRFIPRSAHRPQGVAIADIINFDKAFRAAVAAAWVDDYPWPQNPPDEAKEALP